MRAIPAEGLLTDDELRARVEAFQSGPRTMDRAADCGLFALPISPVFGGFGMPNEALWSVYYMLGAAALRSTWQYVRDELRVAHILRMHWSVCFKIIEYGTYAQYDFLLPQMASGKRIGVDTVYFGNGYLTIHADRVEDGFALRGDTLAWSDVGATSLVLFPAWLDHARRAFLVPAPELPEGRSVKNMRVFYALRGHIVSRITLLGGDDREPPDCEKWRAIRWNSAPSES
jgi:alkylation response protein AidB-like acyl-CoA dehydrogenase